MALIDITPTMTSNTTPSPYVVSASNEVNPAWKAFDGTLIDSTDSWRSSVSTAWLKLDFGSIKKVNAISVTALNFTEASTAPKNFTVYGSNDNISFEQILVITNEVLWSGSEERLFLFPTSVSYRYYKLNFIGNNSTTHTNLQVGLLKFYQDDGITPTEDSKTVSRRYTLPFGSKLRLDNLTSDLTYMLATEDDGDNEGTLRIVNHTGKFILPKAGQKMDLLFDGTASSNGEYTLSNSTKKYKQLIFVTNHLTNPLFKQSNIIAVSDIASYTSTQQTHTMSCHVSTNTSDNVIYISFSSENTFKIYSANNIFGITRVYGIY